MRWYFTGIGAKGEIEAGRPVILFGNLYSPSHNAYINHAIVAYAVMSDGRFIAHFGYPGYRFVIVEGIFGSNTQFIPN